MKNVESQCHNVSQYLTMNQNDCWPPLLLPLLPSCLCSSLCHKKEAGPLQLSLFHLPESLRDKRSAYCPKIELYPKYSRVSYGFLRIHLHVLICISAGQCLISPVLYFVDLSSGTSDTFCFMMLHTLSWSYPQLPNKLRSKLQPFDQPSPGVQGHLARTAF